MIFFSKSDTELNTPRRICFSVINQVYHVTCDNMFEGDLSADALGITACLYAYSHLSFSNGRFARVSACHYHKLREFMFEHPEVKAILGATD
jgi:hypothetical protein